VLVKDKSAPPCLVFGANVDGAAHGFLRRLTDRKDWAAQLDAICSCCEGFTSGDLVGYLQKRDFGPGTWYVVFGGRSAEEIRKEAPRRADIQAFLDANASELQGLTAPELRGAIQAEMRALSTRRGRSTRRSTRNLRIDEGKPRSALSSRQDARCLNVGRPRK
jgi:hypothetical protein